MNTKLLKKLLSSILIVALLSGGFTGGGTVLAAESGTVNSHTAVYVALGDSVPAGYGLSNADDCYVKLFSDEMTENGAPNTMLNYAVSGATTGTLLTGLQNLQTVTPEAFAAIKSAKVITLNIGGNNVLGPMIKAVNEKMAQQLQTLGITSIAQATAAQLQSVALSLAFMKLEEAQLEEIQLGAESFAADFPKIIAWLKTTAPNADIIVSTIYNPIPGSMSFYQVSEKLLQGMNKVITGGAQQGGYYTADVYSAFSKEQNLQLINLNLGQYTASPLSVDIHPTVAGHKLIAKVCQDVFQTIPGIVETNPGLPVSAVLKLSGGIDKKGILTVNVTAQLLTSMIEKAKSEAKQSGREKDGIAVTFENTAAGVKGAKVNFEAAAVDLLKVSGVKKITVSTAAFSFTLDKEAIKELEAKTEDKVTVKVDPVTVLAATAKKLIGSRPVYKISIADAAGNKVTDLGKGSISFNIYYKVSAKEKAGSLYTVSINSKGQPKSILGSGYLNGWVTCTSNIITTYGVAYKK